MRQLKSLLVAALLLILLIFDIYTHSENINTHIAALHLFLHYIPITLSRGSYSSMKPC